MLMQLSNLISIWANEKAVAGSGTDSTNHIDEQTLSRVSCKLDALVLVMLCRQNVQIRKSCLIMLADMYTITEKVRPHSNVPGCLPLYAIILQAESKISRHAMFAFLEHDLNGNCLNPHLSGGQSVIRFSQVAVSDFIGLFKFFIGEVSRQFALLGRAKALRHCVKLLKLLAIPCLSTNATATPSNEFLAAYSSYTILLMSLAGVPDDSETSYTLGPVNTCDNLLFNSFRLHLAPVNLYE